MISKPSVPEIRMFTVNALTWDYGLNVGHILPITACLHPKKKYGDPAVELTILGTMGVQMKESMRTAASLARQTMAAKTHGFMYVDNELIITIPDDPNFMYDGPSAGLATYTAVLGVMSKWTSNPQAALTGELLNNGRIVKVRAVARKIELAQKFDINTIFIPKDNMDEVKKAQPAERTPMHIIGVSFVDQIETLSDSGAVEIRTLEEEEEEEHVETS